MKEFIKHLLVALFCLSLGAIACGVLIDRNSPINIRTVTKSQLDATKTVAINPIDVEFFSLAEVIDAQSEQTEVYNINSVFRQLSSKVLSNVIKVLTDKQLPITIRRIVYEYNNNKTIYDSLSADPPENLNDANSFVSIDEHNTSISARDRPLSNDSTNDSIHININSNT